VFLLAAFVGGSFEAAAAAACIWSISGYHQGKATHTASVYGPWALVIAKVYKRRMPLLSLLLFLSVF